MGWGPCLRHFECDPAQPVAGDFIGRRPVLELSIGAGSTVPGATSVVQERIRANVSLSPRAMPWRSTAWREYSEQVGT